MQTTAMSSWYAEEPMGATIAGYVPPPPSRAPVDDYSDQINPQPVLLTAQRNLPTPDPTIGWYRWSFEHGMFRGYKFESPAEYWQYREYGYQELPSNRAKSVKWPLVVVGCFHCDRLFPSDIHSCIRHCDTREHLRRMSEILDLDQYLPPSGLQVPEKTTAEEDMEDLVTKLSFVSIRDRQAEASVDELAARFGAMGF